MRATAVVLAAVLLLSAASPVVVDGQVPQVSGVGISGSFYELVERLAVPRGGAVNTSEVYIVVYNYGGEEAWVSLNYSAPPGVSVVFEPNETLFKLAPGEHRRLRVIIIVGEDVVPGDYNITVYASVVREAEGGVVVTPAAALDATLHVAGEAAVIHVYAVDPAGAVVRNALIRLYMVREDRLVPVLDSPGGELHARVVPGPYVARVYIAGDLVGEANATLPPGGEETLRIPVRVVFIEFFSVEPVLSPEGTLVAARITVNVKNVYKNIEDASMVLVVERDGAPLEERVLIEQGVLPLGRSSYTFDYVPPGGWAPGNYTFKIRIYGFKGRLLAESEPRWLYNPPPPSIIQRIPIPLPLLAALAAIPPLLLLAWRRRRRRRMRGRPASSGQRPRRG